MYVGDDNLILDSDLSSLYLLYKTYGKPELAYVFEFLRWIESIHPLALRLTSALILWGLIVAFYLILVGNSSDRLPAFLSTAALASSMIWLSNTYAILLPYVYSILLLLIFALICQRALRAGRISLVKSAILFLVGAAGLSYEPLVLFMPLTLSVLTLRERRPLAGWFRPGVEMALAFITAAIVGVHLYWFSVTPASGGYGGINPVTDHGIGQALADFPRHTARFFRAIMDYHIWETQIGGRSAAFLAIVLTGLTLLLFRRRLNPALDTSRGFFVAALTLLLGVLVTGLGLFPFVVAEKVTLDSYGDLTNSFNNRHFFLAVTGLSICIYALVSLSRVSKALTVFSIFVVMSYSALDISRSIRIYGYSASRSLITAAVVEALIRNDGASAANQIIVYPKVVNPRSQSMVLWGWSLWGPMHIWENLSEGKKKLVLSDMKASTLSFIKGTGSTNPWYGFENEIPPINDFKCFVADVDYMPSRLPLIRLVFSYFIDKGLFEYYRDNNIHIREEQCALMAQYDSWNLSASPRM
jgi:hypothetical protein